MKCSGAVAAGVYVLVCVCVWVWGGVHMCFSNLLMHMCVSNPLMHMCTSHSQLPSRAEYDALLKSDSTHAEKVLMTETIYNAVYHGWSQEHVFSKKSCTNKKEKCGLGCRSKVHASYGTKGKHGHMMEHVRRILTMIESGMIEKPGSPDMLEVDERPRTGGVTLGQRTKEGHEMTMKRQKLWADAMEKAQVNPELYSRVVLIPPQNQGLKNRKIEMRMRLFVEDDDGKITDESFVHCFEGTITAVSEMTAAVQGASSGRVQSGQSPRSNGTWGFLRGGKLATMRSIHGCMARRM